MNDASAASSRFVEIRKDLGMTVREISAEIGIASSVYSNWETGSAPARKPNALAIQALYGYRWEWLMTGEEPKRVEGAVPSAHELDAFVGSLFDMADHLSSLGRQLRTAASRVEANR